MRLKTPCAPLEGQQKQRRVKRILLGQSGNFEMQRFCLNVQPEKLVA